MKLTVKILSDSYEDYPNSINCYFKGYCGQNVNGCINDEISLYYCKKYTIFTIGYTKGDIVCRCQKCYDECSYKNSIQKLTPQEVFFLRAIAK